MQVLRVFLLLAVIAIPAAALPALKAGDFPSGTKWYFHVDFKEMQASDAGKHLYAWLQDEVFDDIREETGVDMAKEADFLTAFASEDGGMVMIVDGDISQETEDKVTAMAAASGRLDRFGSGASGFYHVQERDGDDVDVRVSDGDELNIEIDSFEEGAYFSFAVKNKLMVASTRETMESLLDNKGRVSGERATNGQLFVLTAERNLVQAGARTADFYDDHDSDWDSNILRNTEHVALLVAEKAGKIAMEVKLVTREAEMAESLASIVRGLISLQAFSEDPDPDVQAFLQNTKVNVEDTHLEISVALDPETVVAAIE